MLLNRGGLIRSRTAWAVLACLALLLSLPGMHAVCKCVQPEPGARPRVMAEVPGSETVQACFRKPEARPTPGDADGDGILDSGDSEPNGDGVRDLATPDCDGSGIADCAKASLHPDEPDSDGDGIIDRYDTFDNVRGLPTMRAMHLDPELLGLGGLGTAGLDLAMGRADLQGLSPDPAVRANLPENADRGPRSGFGEPPFVPPRVA